MDGDSTRTTRQTSPYMFRLRLVIEAKRSGKLEQIVLNETTLGFMEADNYDYQLGQQSIVSYSDIQNHQRGRAIVGDASVATRVQNENTNNPHNNVLIHTHDLRNSLLVSSRDLCSASTLKLADDFHQRLHVHFPCRSWSS